MGRTVRTASEEDAQALLNIYAPYVRETAISFEYEVPSLEEFRGRIRRTLENYPYLVAEEDGEIAGYAYAGPFVGRKAYEYSAELSIYLRMDQRKKGIGRMLYQALEEALAGQHITNVYACIGLPEREDEYLTSNSVDFHAHLGYREVGRFQNCGYKFGRWYHMVWMEKIIGEHEEDMPPVRPFSESGTITGSTCGT